VSDGGGTRQSTVAPTHIVHFHFNKSKRTEEGKGEKGGHGVRWGTGEAESADLGSRSP